jgi:4-hydroxybenzoate polyprenyltransferase
MKYLFFSFRPTHWLKNLIIFLPLIFGKKLFIFPDNTKSVIAFFLFSTAACAVYLINDIMDYEKDKLHPIKCLRPIASGKITMNQAKITACILSIFSVIFSFMLSIWFGFIIIAYLIFNLIYSMVLKEIIIVDIFCIGGFFLLRIMAGSIVAGVDMSHWIVFMTVLLALFLGTYKKRQELMFLEGKVAYNNYILTDY